MAEGNKNGKNGVTWKWLVGVLLTLLLLIGGGVMANLQADIKALDRDKVDKDRYDKDQQRVEHKLDYIIGQIDKIRGR